MTDIMEAEPLLDKIDPEVFIAGKAYDADPFIELIENRQVTPAVPLKRNDAIHRKSVSSFTKTETSSNSSSSD